MKTRPMADWNYLEVQGQGRYAGDTLSVFSPVKAWYGEGDERIYYDGAKLPAHIGTGTEDYYGYAWGMAGYFSSPFISMPQRDSASQGDWRGYTTTSRLRPARRHSLPNRLEARHGDLELGRHASRLRRGHVLVRPARCKAQSPAAAPGGRRADSRESRRFPHRRGRRVRNAPRRRPIAGAAHRYARRRLAGRAMERRTATVRPGEDQVGDFVELDIPATDDRPRKVTLYGTKSYDYGILRFRVNGNSAGSDFDAYHAVPVASGPIELGRFAPDAGKIRLRVEVVGSNPQSKGAKYFFGLDAVKLSPPECERNANSATIGGKSLDTAEGGCATYSILRREPTVARRGDPRHTTGRAPPANGSAG